MTSDLMRAPLVFALPAGSDAPSGGNVYNRELVRALAAFVPVEVTTVADAIELLEKKRPGHFFFDTLDLEAAFVLPARNGDQRAGLVVHHLPSLEPDVACDDPALRREHEALGRFDLFVATSEFTRDLLASRGFGASAILTVPPALPSITRPKRAYTPPLSALVVANLIPRKGVLPLLEALAALQREPFAFMLRVVGRDDLDPRYAEACRRVVTTSSSLPAAVRFDGPRPYEWMAEAYEASHLLVSASTMETFGMALHEARAHGLPVVAVRGGYTSRHFVHGDSGYACSSAVEAAEKLDELARDARRMSELFARAQATGQPSASTWSEAATTFLSELERVSGKR